MNISLESIWGSLMMEEVSTSETLYTSIRLHGTLTQDTTFILFILSTQQDATT
jgi:hypothetical protein